MGGVYKFACRRANRVVGGSYLHAFRKKTIVRLYPPSNPLSRRQAKLKWKG